MTAGDSTPDEKVANKERDGMEIDTVYGSECFQRISNRLDPNGTADDNRALSDIAMDDDDDYRAEATLRFAVSEISKLGEQKLSASTMVRGLPWKIMVMPRETAGHARPAGGRALGFFLQCNADSDLPNWTCSAHAVLKIISQVEGQPSMEKKIQHVFFPKENDWGYSCFLTFDQLLSSERGLVVDDKAIFEVYVNADAPHGVEWDSKKHTGYVGLKNQGATCYMNSLLQALFFCNKLRKAVYQMPTGTEDPAKNVALAMQRVFYELQFSDKPVGTKKLTRSFGWDTFDSFLQHDVQELNRVLLDNLECKMKGCSQVDGVIPSLFEGKMKSYIRCKDVEFESNREEPFYDIQLNVKGKKNVDESFKDYIEVELLDGDNKYDAGDNGLQAAEKGVTFLTFPPVLHLQLMRFQYDIALDQNVKINDRFEFPERLDLKGYLETPSDTDPATYRLQAVLVHAGDFHGGHYVVYIDPKLNSRWCKFDDDVVSRCTRSEAIDSNFGGSEEGDTGMQRSCTNAYMLVYIRESLQTGLLAPIELNDIPAQLRERLEEEREQEVVRKKEKSESHLFTTVSVVLEDSFEGHQGFDLFENDRLVRRFRVKKTDTIEEFLRVLQDTFKLNENQLRIWPLVQRKNNTLRPVSLRLLLPNSHSSEPSNTTIEEIAPDGNWCVFLETITVGASKTIPPALPPVDKSADVLLFYKFFDAKRQVMIYCGYSIFRLTHCLRRAVEEVCKRMHMPLNTELIVYCEDRPGASMDQYMELDKPIQDVANGILDGDILVFQECLPQCHSADDFFKELSSRVEVEFVDKCDASSSVTITASTRWTYGQVTLAVAEHVNHDAGMIRLFKSSAYRDIPAAQIRFGTSDQAILQQMIEVRTRRPPYRLFYEKMPVPLEEIENRKHLKLIWQPTLTQFEEISVYPDKNGTVVDLLAEVRKAMPDLSPDRKLRLLEMQQNRILRVVENDAKLDEIRGVQPTGRPHRVEPVPDDQMVVDKNEYLLPVAHFQKDTFHTFGTPFLIKVHQGEDFQSVKDRLQKIIEVSTKELEKYKFWLVTPTKPNQIDPSSNFTINLSDLQGSNKTVWLGLDHLNKQSRRPGAYPLEKAIVIHN